MAEALTELNLARKDSRWATQAILQMADLYLNPDGDAMWADKDLGGSPAFLEDVTAARNLLASHKPADAYTNRWRVTECYSLMATKERG